MAAQAEKKMIRVTSKGIPQVQAYIDSVLRGVKTVASEGVAEYLVGDDTHGLKHYPPYRHVPWRSVYGDQFGGFASDAQRKFVMAQIREGKIDPGISSSNGYTRDGWRYRMWQKSTQWTLENDVRHTRWLMGDNEQSKHSQMQGWRKVSRVIADNLRGAFRHGQAKVNEYLRNRKAGR